MQKEVEYKVSKCIRSLKLDGARIVFLDNSPLEIRNSFSDRNSFTPVLNSLREFLLSDYNIPMEQTEMQNQAVIDNQQKNIQED